MATAEIKAVITADDRASDTISRFGGGVGKVAHGMAVGIGVATAAVVGFGALAVKEFSDSQLAGAQLNAVLKSTGGIAGVTAESANELASSLQKVTMFSDEAVVSAESMLLTFTGISKEIFPQVTELALDMATVFKEDAASSANTLGKALNDPIDGLTKLTKKGVVFTAEQENMVRSLSAAGDKMGAQKIILDELQKEYGGSARAAGGTFAGSLIILKNTFGDLMEVIGKGIVDAIQPFVSGLTNFVTNNAPQIQTAIGNIGIAFQSLGTIIGAAFNFAKDVFAQVKPQLDSLWQTIQNDLIPVMMRLWHEVLEPMAPIVRDVFVAAIRLAIQSFQWLIEKGTELANWLITKWTEINNFFTTNPVGKAALEQLRKDFGGTKNDIKQIWNEFGIFWRNNGEDIKRVAILIGIVLGAAFMTVVYQIKFIIAAVRELIHWFNVLQPIARTIASLLTSGGTGIAMEYALGQLKKRAAGGPVMSGTPYMVGEKGPEIFVPNSSGNIVPNSSMSSNSNTTININVGLMTGSAIERREAAMKMFEDLKDIASSKGQTVGQMVGA